MLGSGVGVVKTPVVPFENEAICKSKGRPAPQLRLFQVIASPPVMGLTEQVVEPEPGPLPWMPVPPPPQFKAPFISVPKKSRVSIVTAEPVLLSMTKNAEDPVNEMFCVVKELRLKAGPPLPWHQLPPFPLIAGQVVAAVRLTISFARVLPGSAMSSRADNPLKTKKRCHVGMMWSPQVRQEYPL